MKNKLFTNIVLASVLVLVMVIPGIGMTADTTSGTALQKNETYEAADTEQEAGTYYVMLEVGGKQLIFFVEAHIDHIALSEKISGLAIPYPERDRHSDLLADTQRKLCQWTNEWALLHEPYLTEEEFSFFMRLNYAFEAFYETFDVYDKVFAEYTDEEKLFMGWVHDPEPHMCNESCGLWVDVSELLNENNDSKSNCPERYHNFPTNWTDLGNSTNHYRACQNPNCTAMQEAAHSKYYDFGSNQNQHRVYCYNCNLNKLDSHSFLTYSTHNEKQHKRNCSVCGLYGLFDHSFNNWANYDSNTHKRDCIHCNRTEYENHKMVLIQSSPVTIYKCSVCAYTNSWK
ncbi:MAG: hypothetical protein FWE82_02995 [Defluviitaleaceae bacterium]|nr:hypothetical protein [Defluviitaleaceae bacterium]